MAASASIRVHFLPDLVAPADLTGSSVVVIDVLRASTVIAVALAAGARELLPCLEVDEARAAAARLSPSERLLGGERGGLSIEGFDLGNSPDDYTAERVRGKSIVFTTTNGTRAMQRCRRADRVLIGAFVNGAAVVRELSLAPRVDLLCAGTAGQITREDVLFAGALATGLKRAGGRFMNDQALLAASAFREIAADDGSIGPAALAAALAETQGGRNLAAIGLGRDLVSVARVDSLEVVPELDIPLWSIR